MNIDINQCLSAQGDLLLVVITQGSKQFSQITVRNEYFVYSGTNALQRVITVQNGGEAVDVVLRSNYNLTEEVSWFTDDSVKLLLQDHYTLEDAKRLNITSQ